MLFRYASFKLINPMRRLRALSVAPIKRMNRIVISGVSLTVFFSREAKTNFILIEELEMHALNKALFML